MRSRSVVMRSRSAFEPISLLPHPPQITSVFESSAELCWWAKADLRQLEVVYLENPSASAALRL